MRDLAIAGAGPVGLATAIAATQRGLSCVVYEKRRPPLDKACGEGLMPRGVAALERLGVRVESSAEITGIRYRDGRCVLEGRFGIPGMGVRRTVLSAALQARADALGIDIRYGTPFIENGARYVIGADGLHSSVRERAGIDHRVRPSRRFGVRRHFRVRPWSSYVEIFWGRGAEAYVTPVGPAEVGVALLGTTRFDLEAFPELADVLRDATPTSEVRGAGPFAHDVRRRYRDNYALVGDAAGYSDAITGEGVTLGILCAEALVDVIARGEHLEHYERRYRSLTRTYYALTRLMLTLAERPLLRTAAMRFMPQTVFEQLLALNCGVAAPSRARTLALARTA